ncbi:MAG: hypothetical protein PVG98_02210 [Chromatiales bacterium]|jgi:hypothetical protein
MADILPFKRPKAGGPDRGRTLCRNNHHKWETLKERRFDVKRGRLVTVERCTRCGTTRVRAI